MKVTEIKLKTTGRKRVLPDKVCVCGKIYRPPSSKTKFCGNECARKNRPKKGKTFTCLCGNIFYLQQSHIRARNFCSRRCSHTANITRKTKVCSVCNSSYEVNISQELHRGTSKYCSRKCQGLQKSIEQQGESNPSWRGGVSKENHRLRQSKQFKKWRLAVFTRDDYTCQFCGTRGGYLEPDHIKPFAYFKELRFDVNNGRTLCKPCHKTTDTYGYRAKEKYALQNETR